MTLHSISDVGQRIYFNFSSEDKFTKPGEIDEIFPKKHALFRSNKGQKSKMCRSSSIVEIWGVNLESHL